ncbi:UNVERIFIED_CONTAM: hypothetical protein HDU68_007295, partial [Siphonaria sp. JEL0065]
LPYAIWTNVGNGAKLSPLEVKGIVNNNGVIELFAIAGPTQTMFRSVQNGSSFGAWTAFGSLSYTHDLNVVKLSDGRVQVFVINSDYAVWYSVQASAGSSTYSSFVSIGGALLSMSVIPDVDGTLRILGLGSGNWLYYSKQSGPNVNTWSTFVLLANNLQSVNGWSTQLKTGSLVTAMNGDGRYAVFGLGIGGTASGQVLTLLQSAPNSDTVASWTALPFGAGSFKSISAISTNSQKLVVVGIDTNNNAWYIQQLQAGSSSWGVWSTTGSKISLMTTSMGDGGTIGLYGISTTATQNVLSQIQTTPGDFSVSVTGAQSLGGGPFNLISSTRAGDGTVVLFASYVNGTVALYWAGTQYPACTSTATLTSSCSCQGKFCAAGAYCIGNQCLATCSSKTTLTSACMCGTTNCSSGSTCIDGQCTPACANSTTSFVGTTCNCGNTVCPYGNSVCSAGVCTIIPDDCLTAANLFPAVLSPYQNCCATTFSVPNAEVDCDSSNRVTMV